MTFVLVVAVTFALAALRRCSLAQTVTLTTLAFFLTSQLDSILISSVHGSSISSTRGKTPWLQPCGAQFGGNSNSTERHSVHRTLKRVRTQLRVAQSHFKKQLKYVHEVYEKVNTVLKEQYSLDWLPDKQLEWYHSEIWCLEKGKKAERALPRLHDALQRFAITFYYLRDFHLYSDIDAAIIMIKRNDIMDGMHNEVLRILCEVETAIQNLGLPSPVMHDASVVTEHPHWAKEGDMTLMLIQDWGILRMYRTLLQEWMRAFRNATATGSGVCDPSKLEPLQTKKNKKKLLAIDGKSGNKTNVEPLKKRPSLLEHRNSSSPLLHQNSSLVMKQRKRHRVHRLKKKPKNATMEA